MYTSQGGCDPVGSAPVSGVFLSQFPSGFLMHRQFNPLDAQVSTANPVKLLFPAGPGDYSNSFACYTPCRSNHQI
jgi:hypothetical protein